MENPELASPSRIQNLLELACAYNTPLSVQTESGEQIFRYKSRMLDMMGAPGSRSIIIDQPVADGPAVALSPNSEITLFFAVEQGRYAFDTTVLRRTEYELGNRRKIMALAVAYPNALKSGQRRAYYRVPVPVRMPIHVDCVVIGDIDHETGEESAMNAPLPKGRMHARSIDLSVGGMLVAFESGDIGLADVGTRLTVNFSIAPGETPLRLKAVIRRIIRKSAAEQLRAGIEFVDIDETFEYKLAVNRLYRYIAERQREILQMETKED